MLINYRATRRLSRS